MCYAWLVGLDSRNREVLRAELEGVQVAVAEVGSLFQAFDVVATNGSPSLIIVDLTMPAVLRDSIMKSLLVRGRLDAVPCFAVARFDDTALLAAKPPGSGPGVLGAIARQLCASCRCHEQLGKASPPAMPC